MAQLLQSKGTLAHVEIKPTPGFERETGEEVARLTARLWKDAPVPPLLSSFSFKALMAAKEAAPHSRAAGSRAASAPRIGSA